MTMESVALRSRVADLRALRRSIMAATRTGIRNLNVSEQAALEQSIEDRISEALDEEIAPLIDGLEAEAASFALHSDDGWASEDNAYRSARRMGG